jgi:type II secretory pathway pseudopilin PulG
MRRLREWWPRDRRQAQAGTTLVELLVSVTIMGFALVLIIGTMSTGLLDSTLSKRNTAATAVTEYEINMIGGSAYGALPAQYSDCFTTEDASTPPTTLASYQGQCPSTSLFTLRVDVWWVPGPNNSQVWSIQVNSWPALAQVGAPVQLIRAIR